MHLTRPFMIIIVIVSPLLIAILNFSRLNESFTTMSVSVYADK